MTRWFFILILIAGLWTARRTAFDDDEFQHAHMSWLISRGEIPHRDFFEHHVPLYHLLTTPLMIGEPGPERLGDLRRLNVILLMFTFLMLSRTITGRLGAAPIVPFALCSLAPVFFLKLIENRPAGLALLFSAACLRALGPSNRRTFLAGVFAGAAVMTSQKFLFLSAGFFLLCLQENGFRPTLRFALGGTLVPLGVLGLYTVTGALPGAWQHLVIMNSQWKEHFSPSMYGGLLWRTSAPLLVLSLGACIHGSKHADVRAGLIVTLAGLSGVLLIPNPFRQTFIMLIPGLLLLSSIGWTHVISLVPSLSMRRYVTGCFLLIALLPAAAEINRALTHSLEKDLDHMRELNRTTRGPVFDARGLVWWRKHVGYYPWLHQGLSKMLDPDVYAEETIQALKQANLPPMLEDYRSALFPPELKQFLSDTYVPVNDMGLHRAGITVDRSRLGGSGTGIHVPVEGAWHIEWRGGSVWVNDSPVATGDRLDLKQGTHRVRAEGFVRGLRLVLMEATP